MKFLFFTKRFSLFLICILAFTVVLTPATYAVDGCSSTSFKVATTINLETNILGVTAADFNGDGHLDLIAAPNNNGASEVLLLLGRGGTQQFGPPTSVPVGGQPLIPAVGDFNGDGKPDLLIPLNTFGQPRGFSVLLNDGTGKFGTPNIIVRSQGDLINPVAGDLNNDGKLDIVAGLFTGSSDVKVAIFLANDAGGFPTAANASLITVSGFASGVLIGDFNEDGKRDLALSGQTSGSVQIMFGDGTGGFAAGVSTSTGAALSVLTAGDFNNDGHLDLLSSNQMLLGNGSGGFAAPLIVPLPENTQYKLAGDVNHDGHLDLVTGGLGGLTIMLGNGTGNMVQAQSYASAASAALGDFNEDGKIDLAASQLSGIGILDGDGAGAFNDAFSYHTSLSSPRGTVVADFNNDGKQDFATVGPPFLNVAGVEVALGDGTGGFTRKSFSNFGFSFPISEITTADFNSDGKLDLAVTRPFLGSVYLLLNDGTGGFPADEFSAPQVFAGSGASTIKAGDFNNDTKADLIVITSENFSVLLGDGSGAFTVIPGGALQGFHDLDIGDFNGDGKSDIAVATNGANIITVFKGDGAGHFSNYATAPTPGLALSVVVRDFNGDGKPDIAALSTTSQSLTSPAYVVVLINDGAQGFSPVTNYSIDGAGRLAVGDFNSDNQPDLVMTTKTTIVGGAPGDIVVLTNKGNGQFNAAVKVAAGMLSGDLAAGDFNNDGKADVLFSQPTDRSIVVLLNNFTASVPCLSLNDVTVTEGDTGPTDAIFTVTLSAASTQTISVNYFVSPVPLLLTAATKGADVEDVSGTVTFAPGETTKTISIPIKGDLIDEVDQPFFVVLTTPINAVISHGKGLGTILDNDAPPTLTIHDVAVAEGTQSQSIAELRVSLSGPSEKPITVQFACEDGTATSEVDYHGFSSTMEINPGTVEKTIFVSVIFDNTFEPDETFFVNLSNPTNATIADGLGQATIINDDPQPTIAIASSSRIEGAQGTSGIAAFDVTLSNPSYQAITVSFATANGNATAGSDYIATSGTLTFDPGETTKPIAVEVLGDNIDEIVETFLVNLSSPTNATIAAAQGVGTILDDDGPTISIGSVSVTEGNTGFTDAVFPITLSAPSVQDISVRCSTTSGTATSNSDFLALFGFSVLIPAGATSGTVTVRVRGDLVIENDEQFTVTLLNPSNATIATGQDTATGTITNDDFRGKLQFSSATYSVNEDAGSIVITVNRVEGAIGTATVDFATSNGTAVAGSDYTAVSGTLTFANGETSKSFSIPILSDNSFEEDETINLTLSNPGGLPFSDVTVGNPSTAVVTIKPPPLLLILEELALDPNQVAAVDALLFLRDPFPVISPGDLPLFNSGLDRNTRVLVFVANLQLAPAETASSIRVILMDSNGQSYDVGAEDVRAIPGFNFTQVKFRLPDNLSPGVCNIKIRAHNQETNSGNIRIR